MSLTFGQPTFGAPRRRRDPALDEEPPQVSVAEFDVEAVRRIVEFRTGVVHPHEEPERGDD